MALMAVFLVWSRWEASRLPFWIKRRTVARPKNKIRAVISITVKPDSRFINDIIAKNLAMDV